MLRDMTTDEIIKDRERYEKIVENCKFETPQDVCDFFEAYTQLIWTYKQFGYIYDRYYDDMASQCDNGEVLSGSAPIVAATLQTIAQYPNLECVFCEIHCTGNKETGYKFGQVVYNLGDTKNGVSIYGKGKGTGFEPYEDLEMCECVVQFIEGKWRICDEWENQSRRAYERVLKGYSREEME